MFKKTHGPRSGRFLVTPFAKITKITKRAWSKTPEKCAARQRRPTMTGSILLTSKKSYKLGRRLLYGELEQYPFVTHQMPFSAVIFRGRISLGA